MISWKSIFKNCLIYTSSDNTVAGDVKEKKLFFRYND